MRRMQIFFNIFISIFISLCFLYFISRFFFSCCFLQFSQFFLNDFARDRSSTSAFSITGCFTSTAALRATISI